MKKLAAGIACDSDGGNRKSEQSGSGLQDSPSIPLADVARAPATNLAWPVLSLKSRLEESSKKGGGGRGEEWGCLKALQAEAKATWEL